MQYFMIISTKATKQKCNMQPSLFLSHDLEILQQVKQSARFNCNQKLCEMLSQSQFINQASKLFETK